MPLPIDYANVTMGEYEDPSRRFRFHFGFFLLALLFFGALSGILVLVIPNLERAFESNKFELPLVTRFLIAMSHGVRYFYLWVLFPFIALAVGFFTPTSVLGRKLLRGMMTLVFAAVVIIVALGALLPLTNMMNNMSGYK